MGKKYLRHEKNFDRLIDDKHLGAPLTQALII